MASRWHRRVVGHHLAVLSASLFFHSDPAAASGAATSESPVASSTVKPASAVMPTPGGATLDWPVGSPVVGQNQDGRLEVFRVDVRGELFHKWQKETNGDWSPWVSLGGWLWPDIAVANQEDGRLEAFAVDRVTRLLRYKWQTAPNHPDFDWTTWITVGDSSMFRPPA